MKYFLHPVRVAAVLLFCFGQILHAQMPRSGNPLTPAMLKMFGSQTNFSANMEMQISGASAPIDMTAKMVLSGKKLRAEVNLENIKSKSLSPELATQVKQMGADRTIILARPDKSVTYMIYPSLNAYVEMPFTQADKDAMAREPKIVTTAQGKETIDGHPCVKNKVVATDAKGKTQDLMVWNATDLKNFPVQMQMKEKDATIVTKFKNIQFVKSDARQFEPPPGLKKYAGMSELQQVMMQRMKAKPSK